MTIHSPNPYNNTGPIRRSSQFFNRKALTEDVLDSLFSDSLPCLSIVGQTKIGVSSFVHHLSDPATLAELGYDASKHLFVYINCARYDTLSPEDFYRLLLKSLFIEISKKLPDTAQKYPVNILNPASWKDEWDQLLPLLAKDKFFIVVTLDEFDAIVMQKDLLKGRFFGSLRSYGSDPNFAWITCTYQPLHPLFQQAYEASNISLTDRWTRSDFYNIFTVQRRISLFIQEDVEELISNPSKDAGVTFSSEEKRRIRSFGGRFPYFIQRACYHFFEAHRKGVVEYNDILRECIDDVGDIWTDYWTKLTPEQQRILYSIASGHPVEASLNLENLKDQALIYEEQGYYFPFSEQFGRFLLTRRHPYMGLPVNLGDILWGEYEVKEVASRTLHSQVVKAQEIILQRQWAIKLLCINQDHKGEEAHQLQENLIREAKILVSLKHKNIGKIHEVKSAEPLGIVMQWIEGNSLFKILMEQTPMSPISTTRVGLQLARALRYVHKKGITHRDIKPLNIILKPNGDPVLIDFDIARSKEHHTITYSPSGSMLRVGTQDYSAPEQFSHPERVGPPADLFALGVVLYELLTHERPYLDERDLPPEQQNIPEPLYKILCKLLHWQPEQRPTAAELCETLQECLTILDMNNKQVQMM